MRLLHWLVALPAPFLLAGCGAEEPNLPPEAPAVELSPASPTSIDDIHVGVTAHDPNGDPLSYHYEWRRGAIVSTLPTLFAYSTDRFDEFVLTVKADDGELLSPPTSIRFTVGNAPPEITSLNIPLHIRAGNVVSPTISSSDPERDPISYEYEWFIDDTLVSTEPTLDESVAFVKGQVIRVEVRANDGYDLGPPMASPARTVENSGPVGHVAGLLPESPTPGSDDLVCTVAEAATDPDGDAIDHYSFYWQRDGQPYYYTSTTYMADDTIVGSRTQLGELWMCAIWASDGESASQGRSVYKSFRVGRDLEAGAEHYCQLGSNAVVSCAGNEFIDELTPPPGRYRKVAAGDRFSCAIEDDWTISCWGHPIFDEGQTSPPYGTYIDIDAGGDQACAVTESGTVKCWGNTWGGSNRFGPFDKVTTGGQARSCAIDRDQHLECWGPDVGETPDGTFLDVSSSASHTCAIDTEGSITCFDGLQVNGSMSPPKYGTFTEVAVGLNFGCAITDYGAIRCWGLDNVGQASPPTSSSDFSHIVAGDTFACAYRGAYYMDCWGEF